MQAAYGRKRHTGRRRRGIQKNENLKTIAILLFVIVISIPIANLEIRRADAGRSDRLIADRLSGGIRSPGSNDKISRLCDTLAKQLGKPYVYGSDGPDAFDCSGLVEYAYSSVGIKLPRVLALQAEVGCPVSKEELRFGDIVFFSGDGVRLTHEGIYIGDGYVIHAPKTGDVVKINRMDSGYYADAFRYAVRILAPD